MLQEKTPFFRPCPPAISEVFAAAESAANAVAQLPKKMVETTKAEKTMKAIRFSILHMCWDLTPF